MHGSKKDRVLRGVGLREVRHVDPRESCGVRYVHILLSHTTLERLWQISMASTSWVGLQGVHRSSRVAACVPYGLDHQLSFQATLAHLDLVFRETICSFP